MIEMKTQELSEREVQRLIEQNRFPARVLEVGRAWVKLDLSDEVTGIGRIEIMSKSAFADLILDWRARGCHLFAPCSGLSVQVAA